MKYPITPEFMYSLPLPLMRLYQRLEEQILEDICSRVAMTGEMTETAIEHIRSLQRRGYDYKKINEYIRKTLKLTQSEFDAAWNKAVQRNQQYFDTLIDDNLILGENNFNADLFVQEINAIEMQTLGELTNITRSMGFAYRAPDGTVKVDDIGRMYQRVLDDALMRVESGQSYNVAIRDATKMLTDSGLQYVDYESGWHNRVDVAARRAVMTGVTQLSRQYTEQTATLMDTPYREVTAHRGARDGEGKTPWASHKKWQGRVYSVRTGDIYPSIYEVCGLDEVDGLCGANCRHMYHIWIEGVSERTYTDEELENIDPPPFEFDGKQYTFYEATQKQRQVEASLRKVKRELIAAKGRGDDEEYTTKAVRYRRLNEEYKAFSKAAGLRPQYERGNIAEFGPKEAREAAKANKDYLDRQQINSPVNSRNTAKGRPSAVLQYNVELNKRQENLLSRLTEYDSRVTVRKADVSLNDLSALTAKTGVEYALFTKGGERLIIRGSSTKVNIDIAKAKELAYNGYRWSGHTHPGSDENTLIASGGDYEVLKAFGQKTSVIYNSLGRYMCFSTE
ncbi:phage minor capsid protein [Hominenteromicrobium sp.]|jgi:hypothetical protein|uniref:phage minor capsid protein n=2 Tax=Hominenteromicrobium sp. TaxID=3073581 RepID=UPI00204A01FA|nr:MAG TPA: minor capsid protein [Bacteriophage sp.]